MFLGNPLVAGLLTLAVSGRAMQGYAPAPVIAALGQQRSLSIPIATLLPPSHLSFIFNLSTFKCNPYIYLLQGRCSKRRNRSPSSAGRARARCLSSTTRCRCGTTSMKVRNSSNVCRLTRFAPFASHSSLRWTGVRCSCDSRSEFTLFLKKSQHYKQLIKFFSNFVMYY